MKASISILAIFASTLLPLLCTTSCREKGEVHHFQVEKAKATPASQKFPTAAQPSNAPYSWTLPEGWTDQPASGMRLATIIIPTSTDSLNASITEFGGDLVGNVNRWRGQIGLPHLSEAEILPNLKIVETTLGKEGKAYIATLINPASPDKAMLAAIIPRPSGTSVFIKVTGSADALKSIAEPFSQFTKSLKK